MKNSLYLNIRNKAKQNRASGATPKKPTREMLNQERKIKAKQYAEGSFVGEDEKLPTYNYANKEGVVGGPTQVDGGTRVPVGPDGLPLVNMREFEVTSTPTGYAPGEIIKERRDFKPWSNWASTEASGGEKRQETYGNLGDLYAYYGGQPLKHNVLKQSKYKPTKAKNANSNYISINDSQFKQEIIDNYNRVFNENKLLKGEKKINDNTYAVSGYTRPTKEQMKKSKSGELYFEKGKDHVSNAIGHYYLSKGNDDKGDYISYYDVFDAGTGGSDGGGIGETLGLTKPFEIYDRIYIDPKTGKPINEKAEGGFYPTQGPPKALFKGYATGGPEDEYIPSGPGGEMPLDLPLKEQNPYLVPEYNQPMANGYILPDPNRPRILPDVYATEYKSGIEIDGREHQVPTIVGGQYIGNYDWNRYNLTGEEFKPMTDPSSYSKFYDTIEPLGLMKDTRTFPGGGYTGFGGLGGPGGIKPTRSDSLNVYNSTLDSIRFYDRKSPYVNRTVSNYFEPYYRDATNSGEIERQTLEHHATSPRQKAIIKANKNPRVHYINDLITGGLDPNAPLQRYDERIQPQGQISYYRKTAVDDFAKKFNLNKRSNVNLRDAFVNLINSSDATTPLGSNEYKRRKEKVLKEISNKLGIPYNTLLREHDITRAKEDAIIKNTPGIDTSLPFYDPIAIAPFDILKPHERAERLKKYGPNGIPTGYIDAVKNNTVDQYNNSKSGSTSDTPIIDRTPVQVNRLDPLKLTNIPIEETPLKLNLSNTEYKEPFKPSRVVLREMGNIRRYNNNEPYKATHEVYMDDGNQWRPVSNEEYETYKKQYPGSDQPLGWTGKKEHATGGPYDDLLYDNTSFGGGDKFRKQVLSSPLNEGQVVGKPGMDWATNWVSDPEFAKRFADNFPASNKVTDVQDFFTIKKNNEIRSDRDAANLTSSFNLVPSLVKDINDTQFLYNSNPTTNDELYNTYSSKYTDEDIKDVNKQLVKNPQAFTDPYGTAVIRNHANDPGQSGAESAANHEIWHQVVVPTDAKDFAGNRVMEDLAKAYKGKFGMPHPSTWYTDDKGKPVVPSKEEFYPMLQQLRMDNKFQPGEIIDDARLDAVRKSGSTNPLLRHYNNELLKKYLNTFASNIGQPTTPQYASRGGYYATGSFVEGEDDKNKNVVLRPVDYYNPETGAIKTVNTSDDRQTWINSDDPTQTIQHQLPEFEVVADFPTQQEYMNALEKSNPAEWLRRQPASGRADYVPVEAFMAGPAANLAKSAVVGGSRMLGTAMAAPLTVGSRTIPWLTAGDVVNAGFGLHGAYKLSDDINSGYYTSDAPMVDKITRGLGTGLDLAFTPGVMSAVGKGLKADLKNLKSLRDVIRENRNKNRLDFSDVGIFGHAPGTPEYNRWSAILRGNADNITSEAANDLMPTTYSLEASNNQLPLPPREIVINPDGTVRSFFNQQPISTYDVNLLQQDYVRMMNGYSPANYPNIATLEENVAQQIAHRRPNAPIPGSLYPSSLYGVINKSGLNREEALLKATTKDKEAIAKMTDKEFSKTVSKPNGEIVEYKSGMDIPELGYNKDAQLIVDAIPMTGDEYVKIFNDNIHILNEIIAKNNRTGIPYEVVGLDKYGQLRFRTPKKIVNGREISGDVTWSTRINPGEWRGEVQDIANAEYYKGIPGINMSGSSNSVFADKVPREGSGAYKSINEYLKKLDLGRVKPGFNVQTTTEYDNLGNIFMPGSKEVWEHYIKAGDAFGYYHRPDVVYGTMKSILPYIGTGAVGIGAIKKYYNNKQKQATGGYTNPYNPYHKDPHYQYKVGGKVWQDIGAGAYGVLSGTLGTITGGLTDPLMDMGEDALQKAANPNFDPNNPEDVKAMREINTVGAAGQIGGSILGLTVNPGNVGSAVAGAGKGANEIVQSSTASDSAKQWSKGISGVMQMGHSMNGMGAGSSSGSKAGTTTGGKGASSFGDVMTNFSGSKFGKSAKQAMPFVNQAAGMLGGNDGSLLEQGVARQNYLNSPEYLELQRQGNVVVNQGVNFSQGGNITNNSLNLRNTMRYKRFAKGGTFDQYGINYIPESAGLHHESAYGGVPIGPNALAEGGEIKMDTGDGGQYIVSDQVDGAESQKDFTFSKGGKYKELNRTLADGMKKDLDRYTFGSLATSDRVKGDLRRPFDSYSQSTIEQIKNKWQQKTEYARQRSQQEQAIAQAEEQKRMAEEQYIAAYGGKINPKKYPGLNMSKKAKGGYVHNQMIQPMLATGGPVYGDPASPYTYAMGGMYGNPYYRGGQIDYTNDMYSSYASGGPMVGNAPQAFNGPAAQNRGGMLMNYADGGMVSPEKQMMQQQMMQQQQAPQEQMQQQGGEEQMMQMVQQVAEAIMGGANPEEVMQQLVQSGVPPEQAQQIIQAAMQMASQQQPMQQGQQMMPQQGMAQGGMMPQQSGTATQIAEALQQGAQPQEVLQQLVESGMPQEQAMEMVKAVMGQLKNQMQQQQPQQQMMAPQQGMMARGGKMYYRGGPDGPPYDLPGMADMSSSEYNSINSYLTNLNTPNFVDNQGNTSSILSRMSNNSNSKLPTSKNPVNKQNPNLQQSIYTPTEGTQFINYDENGNPIYDSSAGSPFTTSGSTFKSDSFNFNPNTNYNIPGSKSYSTDQSASQVTAPANMTQVIKGGNGNSLSSNNRGLSSNNGGSSTNTNKMFPESWQTTAAGLAQAIPGIAGAAFAFGKLKNRKLTPSLTPSTTVDYTPERIALMEEGRRGIGMALDTMKRNAPTSGSYMGNAREAVLRGNKVLGAQISKSWQDQKNEQAKYDFEAGKINADTRNKINEMNEGMYQNAIEQGFRSSQDAVNKVANYYTGKEGRDIERWQAQNTNTTNYTYRKNPTTGVVEKVYVKDGKFFDMSGNPVD